MSLLKLATLFRSAQLYAHHCHNLVKGNHFFTDHDFFGELYPLYEKAYDGCVERYLGLGNPSIDTIELAKGSLDMISDFPKEGGECNRVFYQAILKIEKGLVACIEDCIREKMSEGTRQMIGTLADESEMRQYKIRQRLKS